jgi:hypothetical protein
MPDSKITALASTGTGTDPANDPLVIVDVSDTSMAATGTTKKVTLNQLLACSPTATLASATITGDLTVNTNVLKVDSTNDRVGIGTATPRSGFALDVLGNAALGDSTTIGSARLTIDGSGTAGNVPLIRFRSAGVQKALFGLSGGFFGDTSTDALIATDAAGAAIRFCVSDTGTEAMRLNSTGLGVGGSPATKIFASVTPPSAGQDGMRVSDGTRLIQMSISGSTYSYGGIGANQNVIYASGNPLSILSDSQNLRIGTGTNAYMLLDTAGNVGVGVTPSAWAAGVKGFEIGSLGSGISSGSTFSGTLYSTCNAYNDGSWKYARNAAASLFGLNSDKSFAWFQNSNSPSIGGAITWTQAMTLDASGNLLVGTTSLIGVERFNVTKTTVGSYLARFNNTNTTADTYGVAITYTASTPNDASHNFLGCVDSVGSRALIYANGGLANYSANNVNLSDSRTKTDIKPLTSYWNKIKALEVVTFKYKDQTHSDDNIGLISQQVESVAPEFVSNDGFGETPVDGIPLKAIYTTDLYHAAIKALQEAMTRIEALEAKLA